MQRSWMSGTGRAAWIVTLLSVAACAERAPTEASPPPPAMAAPSSEALSGLRDQARHAPEAAIEALDALGTDHDPDLLAELAQLRALAETNRFNASLKALAANPDLREAIETIFELIRRPAPVNKQRLAEPVWGLIGKLEAMTTTKPGFVTAATERLLADAPLNDFMGPQMGARLRAARGAARAKKVSERTRTLLASKPFAEVLTQLTRWSKGPAKVDAAALEVAHGLVLDALEARKVEGPDDSRTLRADAGAVLPSLEAASGLRDRVEALVESAGAGVMAQWMDTIAAARRRPIDATRHGCQAMKFALTSGERAAIEAAIAPAQASLERDAGRASRGYITAIAKRDMETWRTLETPFMGGADGDEAIFAAAKRRWLEGARALDPGNHDLVVTSAELDGCKARTTLTLGRDETRRDATIAMCWQAEDRRWYPCHPLTRWSAKARIRP